MVTFPVFSIQLQDRMREWRISATVHKTKRPTAGIKPTAVLLRGDRSVQERSAEIIQTPLHRPRLRAGVGAQILKLLKLVIIQQFDGRGGQIRWNAHGDSTASDVTEMLYGTAKPKPAPLTLTSHHPFLRCLQLSGLTSSSPGLWPRLGRLSYYHNYPGGVGGSRRMAEAAHV